MSTLTKRSTNQSSVLFPDLIDQINLIMSAATSNFRKWVRKIVFWHQKYNPAASGRGIAANLLELCRLMVTIEFALVPMLCVGNHTGDG